MMKFWTVTSDTEDGTSTTLHADKLEALAAHEAAVKLDWEETWPGVPFPGAERAASQLSDEVGYLNWHYITEHDVDGVVPAADHYARVDELLRHSTITLEQARSARRELRTLKDAVYETVKDYDLCSGAEPSLSLLFRQIDLYLRAAFLGYSWDGDTLIVPDGDDVTNEGRRAMWVLARSIRTVSGKVLKSNGEADGQ